MPAADWPAALADIDRAVVAAVADLNGYEERWRNVLGEQPGWPGQSPRCPGDETGASRTLPRAPEEVGDRDDWDDRLSAVLELAESADRDLAARAEAVAAWRESLQRALHLVEGEPCHGSR